MPEDVAQSAVDEVKPIPPRYRWLKRIGVAVGIIIVMLIGLRLAWGWYAERQLRAEIDHYRAAGEPIDLTDFDPPPVADKDNGALPLQEAARVLARLDPNLTQLILAVCGEPEVFAKRRGDVCWAMEATAEVRALVRSARAMPGADWGIRLRSPVTNVPLTGLAMDRQISKLLLIAATYYHQEQNDREAVEPLHDLFAQARHVDSKPLLISHLVALAMDTLGVHGIEEMAPSLRVKDGPGARDGTTPATRQQVEALTRELLDDREWSQRFVRALQADRAVDLDWAESVAQGRSRYPLTFGATGPPDLLDRALAWVFKPMIQLDTIRRMRDTTTGIRAAKERSWATARPHGAPDPTDAAGLKRATRLISKRMVSLNTGIAQHFRALAFRRMAGVALAIRLYEIDHGRRPETLEELVPRYLPFVPPDPFASDGRKIGYRPHAPKPLLYSINENGIDDEGQYGLWPYGSVDRRAKDLPFFLNGDRPRMRSPATTTASAPVASSQTVDN